MDHGAGVPVIKESGLQRGSFWRGGFLHSGESFSELIPLVVFPPSNIEWGIQYKKGR